MNLKVRANEMRSFFNSKIDSYDQVHESFMDTKKALVESLDDNTFKVLDLGAGTGLELIYLFERFPNINVTVIDVSENMLRELKNRYFEGNVNCICGDFFEVDFGNDYDAVISTSALHHFNEVDKLRLYKKVLSCLKDNGLFINCDKVALSIEEQDKCLRDYNDNPNMRPHMDTPLTKDNEVKILNEAGFSSVHDIESVLLKDNYALIKAVK